MAKRNYRPLKLEDVTQKKGRFDEEEEDFIPDMSELEGPEDEAFSAMAQENEEVADDSEGEALLSAELSSAELEVNDDEEPDIFDRDALQSAIAQVIMDQKEKSEEAQKRIAAKNAESRKISATMRISGE